AISTVASMLFILGSLFALLLTLSSYASNVEHRMNLSAFINDSATPQQVATLMADIKANPSINQYTYVTKDQAKQKLVKDLPKLPSGTDLSSGGIDTSALPASVDIKVNDPNKIATVAAAIQQEPAVQQVV